MSNTNALLFAALDLAAAIEDARDARDAREGDWEESCAARAYLEHLNETAQDSIPVEEIEAITADIRAARAAAEAADEKLQALVDAKAAMQRRASAAAEKASRWSGRDYDRECEREDFAHRIFRRMTAPSSPSPINAWWDTIEV